MEAIPLARSGRKLARDGPFPENGQTVQLGFSLRTGQAGTATYQLLPGVLDHDAGGPASAKPANFSAD
jgi:hypothetical protein